MRLRNKWARGVIQSGQALRTPLWDKGLTGAGQIVGMADTGNPVCWCWLTKLNHDSMEWLTLVTPAESLSLSLSLSLYTHTHKHTHTLTHSLTHW